jgi:hypothetical protein
MVWSPAATLPKGPPDVTTLAADIGTACFRRSFFEHGEITPAYRDAAVAAMTGFLAPYVESGADRKESARKGAAQRARSSR